MGVHPATSFLAWFLENTAVMAVGSAALAVVLKTSGIFTYSNAFVVFLFLLDFGVSVVMLSYLLSACFRRAPTAALCCSLLYMASFLPYAVLLVLRSRLSVAAQMLLVSARLCRDAQGGRTPPPTTRVTASPLPAVPPAGLLVSSPQGPAGAQAAQIGVSPPSPCRGDGVIPSTHGSMWHQTPAPRMEERNSIAVVA